MFKLVGLFTSLTKVGQGIIILEEGSGLKIERGTVCSELGSERPATPLYLKNKLGDCRWEPGLSL